MVKLMKLIQRKDWDSQFFDFNIYSTLVKNLNSELIKEIDDAANRYNVKLLYHFENEDSSNKECLEANDFKFIQNKLFLIKDIEIDNYSKLKDFNNIGIFESDIDKIEDLYLISTPLIKLSRFYQDDNIPKNKVKELYTTWINNSLTGKYADKVFVYRKNNSIIGFCAIQKNCVSKEIKISLIAVNEEYRNKSIGSNLLRYCFNYYSNMGYKKCFVSTQMDNLSAVKFYVKNGFTKLKSEIVYHKWYGRD